MKVLLTDYAWPDLEIERRELSASGAELIVATDAQESTLCRLAADADAIMTCWAEVTELIVAAATRCRIVSRMGIGLDNIDVDACTARGIPVTNVPDYCIAEVAEHALSLLLTCARRTAFFHHQTKSGVYNRTAGLPIRRLEGQTLGIVGLGRTGRALAAKAAGLGLRILATRRSADAPAGIGLCSLQELLAESDFVSLHVPLTLETERMISAPQFAHMKRSAVIINTARGGLIDHDELARALQAGQIAGAALDVQPQEPPDLSKEPYCLPNVVVTPHAAFVSEESVTELRQRACRQVVVCLRGERPPNIVNL